MLRGLLLQVWPRFDLLTRHSPNPVLERCKHDANRCNERSSAECNENRRRTPHLIQSLDVDSSRTGSSGAKK